MFVCVVAAAFGLHVVGGISDGHGSLMTLIRNVTPNSPAHIAGLQPGELPALRYASFSVCDDVQKQSGRQARKARHRKKLGI